MAIVCSQSGHYFDVPDSELSKYAKTPEEAGKSDVQGRSAEGPGGPEGGGPGGQCGPGGGMGGGSSPIQIIVNYIQSSGGGGGGMPPPAGGEGAGAKKGEDVGGRYCGWHNCWRNCWRNYHFYRH